MGVHRFKDIPSFKDIQALCDHYKPLFSNKLGTFDGPAVELDVTSKPPFFKARPVPYAQQHDVEVSLLKMEEGILVRVLNAPCAAPIVPVPMKDSHDVRICGDFSITFNAYVGMVSYPIPKIEDRHAALRGCTVFSILDMSQAYYQIPVAKESQQEAQRP